MLRLWPSWGLEAWNRLKIHFQVLNNPLKTKEIWTALKSIKRKSWNSNVNSCTFHYQRISCLIFWGVPNVYVVSWTICFCHINQLWRYHLPAGFPTRLSQAFYLRWHPYNVKCAFNSWGEQLLSDTFYNGKRWGVLKAKTLDKMQFGIICKSG